MRDNTPRTVLLVLLAVGLVGSVLPAAAAGAERATTKGVFNVNCSFSHRASDDPIVFPGRPGATHSHDFAGNVDTNAFSTPNSLRAGITNCEHYAPSTGRRGDQAAYWFPTLYVNGRPVTPTRVTAYYQSGDRKTSKIKPFPAQLKMIAGDASGAVDYRRLGAGFSCSTTLAPGTRTVAPTCAPGSTLVGTIRFPDCWDGRRNDSRNHKRHMAYSKWDGDGSRLPAYPPGAGAAADHREPLPHGRRSHDKAVFGRREHVARGLHERLEDAQADPARQRLFGAGFVLRRQGPANQTPP